MSYPLVDLGVGIGRLLRSQYLPKGTIKLTLRFFTRITASFSRLERWYGPKSGKRLDLLEAKELLADVLLRIFIESVAFSCSLSRLPSELFSSLG